MPRLQLLVATIHTNHHSYVPSSKYQVAFLGQSAMLFWPTRRVRTSLVLIATIVHRFFGFGDASVQFILHQRFGIVQKKGFLTRRTLKGNVKQFIEVQPLPTASNNFQSLQHKQSSQRPWQDPWGSHAAWFGSAPPCDQPSFGLALPSQSHSEHLWCNTSFSVEAHRNLKL